MSQYWGKSNSFHLTGPEIIIFIHLSSPRRHYVQAKKTVLCNLVSFFVFSAEDLSDVFGKREVKQEKSKTVAVSQLSRQLEESIGKPNNPFLEYSKFDGEVSWEKSFWFLVSLRDVFDAKIVWNVILQIILPEFIL